MPSTTCPPYTWHLRMTNQDKSRLIASPRESNAPHGVRLVTWRTSGWYQLDDSMIEYCNCLENVKANTHSSSFWGIKVYLVMFGGASTSFVAEVSWVSAWYMRSLVYLPFGWCLSSNFLPFSSWPVTQAGWLSFWERSSGWHYHAKPFSEVFGTYTNLILCLPVSVLVSDYCRGLSRIRTEVQSTTWALSTLPLTDKWRKWPQEFCTKGV